jgi:hypothetical protein
MDSEGRDKQSPLNSIRRIGPSEETQRRNHNQLLLEKTKRQEEAKKAAASATSGTTPGDVTMEDELKSVLVAMVKSQALMGKAILETLRKVEMLNVQVASLESSVLEELRFLSEIVLVGPAEAKGQPPSPSQE